MQFAAPLRNRLIASVALWALALVILYPFLNLTFGSLKTQGDFFSNPVGPPTTIEWSNYAAAWQLAHIPQFTVNSAQVAAGTVLLTLFSAATCSYALSRFRFRGHRLVYLAFIVLFLQQRRSRSVFGDLSSAVRRGSCSFEARKPSTTT
jgi:ABC-type glycerol-3-phosphate transport system permease component